MKNIHIRSSPYGPLRFVLAPKSQLSVCLFPEDTSREREKVLPEEVVLIMCPRDRKRQLVFFDIPTQLYNYVKLKIIISETTSLSPYAVTDIMRVPGFAFEKIESFKLKLDGETCERDGIKFIINLSHLSLSCWEIIFSSRRCLSNPNVQLFLIKNCKLRIVLASRRVFKTTVLMQLTQIDIAC